MIALFVNYSTVAFPLHLPTLKRQQFLVGNMTFFPANSQRRQRTAVVLALVNVGGKRR